MGDDIVIRPLATQADFQACVDLQRDTWGHDFSDTVPASILLVGQKIGGVSAGAFARDGSLVGFVFGLTGVENGTTVHWSDMLAVRPDLQNSRIGRRLKEFQRRAVERVGATVIYWTFDPLVARNAHLNFNVFGVRAVQYARDMYGLATRSDLHRAIGTDRLVVAWPVSDGDLAERKHETAAARDADAYKTAPVVGDAERTDHRWDASIGKEPYVRVAVPLDILTIQSGDPDRATRWRESTRLAFETAFARRYEVDGFLTDAAQERGFYLMSAPPPPQRAEHRRPRAR